MLILLSPAKSLDYETDLPETAATMPQFVSQSAELIATLKKKSEAAALVASLRDAYNSGLTAKRQWRINQLNALRQMVVDNDPRSECCFISAL